MKDPFIPFRLQPKQELIPCLASIIQRIEEAYGSNNTFLRVFTSRRFGELELKSLRRLVENVSTRQMS